MSPASGIPLLSRDDTMSQVGWKRLLDGSPWFRGEDAYPIPAYSEFMPPPRLARSPYGATVASPLAEDDPWGWRISEREEAAELRPGLEQVARQVVPALAKLCRGESSHGIARSKLRGNVYWPEELAERAGSLGHERFVVLMPLALSRTQNDQGRLRWTLFGGSEQGPARAFWRGFFTAPDREAPTEQAIGFLRSLLARAYGEPSEGRKNLRALGFRILPQGELPDPLPSWPEGPAPKLDRHLPLVRGRVDPRRPLSPDVPALRRLARPRPQGLPRGPAPPPAMPGQPPVLGDAPRAEAARRAAPGDAGPTPEPDREARRPPRPPRAPIGLVARAGPRLARPGRARGPRQEHLSSDPPDDPGAPRRGRLIGGRRPRGPDGARAVRRLRGDRALRQADGAKRADLDRGSPAPARRPQRGPGGDRGGGGGP